MRVKRTWAILAATLLTAGLGSTPVLAEKPDWAGGGKHERGSGGGGDRGHGGGREDYGRHDGGGYGDRDHRGDRDGPRSGASFHFADRQRSTIHSYYREEFSRGNCPPGLAKKHNGCMPPGQARKWSRGRPLPRDVVYYDLPRSLVLEIGPPPSGYRYVRVASDILMIAVGSMMVVDAIDDLSR
ncbi:MAG: hypothetical protein JNJ44_04385 [Zoogloeaceae bacterium]|nr:hypothetical protein [Zoogloeaceae bacterium]